MYLCKSISTIVGSWEDARWEVRHKRASACLQLRSLQKGQKFYVSWGRGKFSLVVVKKVCWDDGADVFDLSFHEPLSIEPNDLAAEGFPVYRLEADAIDEALEDQVALRKSAEASFVPLRARAAEKAAEKAKREAEKAAENVRKEAEKAEKAAEKAAEKERKEAEKAEKAAERERKEAEKAEKAAEEKERREAEREAAAQKAEEDKALKEAEKAAEKARKQNERTLTVLLATSELPDGLGKDGRIGQPHKQVVRDCTALFSSRLCSQPPVSGKDRKTFGPRLYSLLLSSISVAPGANDERYKIEPVGAGNAQCTATAHCHRLCSTPRKIGL